MQTSENNASQNELEIVRLFNENVRGKPIDTSSSNTRHDGKDGHWLEKQMGIAHNRNTEPDLLGFEMKNNTGGKTTFGDWSANYYIFKNPEAKLTRSDFLKIFGKPNIDKNNRYSWSGSPIPTVKHNSSYNGSRLVIDDNTHNISIVYDYSKDPREYKNVIVPEHLQVDNLILAQWYGENLKKNLLKKFGQGGWFKCYKNSEGVYARIAFGEPITFENWINWVRQGIVYFDSGMYDGNSRNYSQWRANNSHWDSLIVREY